MPRAQRPGDITQEGGVKRRGSRLVSGDIGQEEGGLKRQKKEDRGRDTEANGPRDQDVIRQEDGGVSWRKGQVAETSGAEAA
jgi:hypothetical protein